jgi:protein involved in polysaccharide export with SLBB domain/capsular polysaccharide biosynthesis protein
MEHFVTMSDLAIPSTLPLTVPARTLRRPVTARRRSEIVEVDAEQKGTPASIQLPFDPLRLIDALVRRWWLMLIVGCIFASALFIVGKTRFETLHSAQAQIIKQETASAFRQSDSGESFKPRDFTIPTFVSLMHSSAMVEAASKRLEGRVPESALRVGLVVTPMRNTDIVSISMTSNESPDAALQMLQAYTSEVLNLARELQRGSASDMREFLQQQIERTDGDLVKANEELLNYGRREQLIDADKQMDAWLGELGNFTLKYETLKLDHETLDLRIQGVEKELAKVDTNAARLDATRREVAELAVRYTDEHPTMMEAREKLAAMEQQIAAAGPRTDAPPKPGESSVAESLYLDLVRLRSEKKVMSEQLTKLNTVRDGLNERLAQLPRKAMEYARIKSKQQTLESSRALLASRQREAMLFEENAQGFFKLFAMDRPQDIESVPPTQKLAMATGGGFVAGAGMVAFAVIMLTLLDGRIRSGGDLKRATGVPVIGLMPQDQRQLHESEAAWAFRTWTRLQPMLVIPARGEATVCGIMHDGDAESAARMTQRLASAAVRRGLSSIAIVPASESTTLSLGDALYDPELVTTHLRLQRGEVCTLSTDEAWTWTPGQRQQWLAALAKWRSAPEVVILITLPSVEQPESLLLAEKLPNLLWIGSSGSTRVQSVSDSLRMYRDSGCRLVAAVLDRAPVLKPMALAKFAALLVLSANVVQAEPVARLSKAENEVSALTNQNQHVEVSQETLASPLERQATSLPLGPGDAVNINMPGMEGHEREAVPIGPDGRLTYLQARDIVAAGLSVDQLRAKLTTELRRYYKSAKVVVTPFTFQSRKIYVLGKVVKKGAINLDRPMSLLEVVAEAGGLETGLFQQNTVELADLGRSFVMRGQQRLPLNLEALFLKGDMSQNVRVEPGDYVYFPSANSNEIYVLGDVKMQGTQGLLGHTSVHSAIAQAGGFTPKAYTQRILVIRGSLEKPERFVVDMNDILTARSTGFRLEPKDIVYVADRPWARAEELVNIAINSFLQGAVSSWTRANVGPFIKEPLLPQIR